MKRNLDETAKAYGTDTIISSFTPQSIEEYSRTTTRFGLGWDSAWIYCSLTSAGGQKYALMRGYEKTSSSLFMTNRLLEDTRGVSPRMYKSLYIGPSFFDQVPGQKTLRVKSYPSKHNFQIDLEAGRFHHQEENGNIDLFFESLGPACRFLIPGARIKEDLYYTSELCSVKGKVEGEEVTGFGGLDQAWLPHGIGWAQSKCYLYFEEYWLVWANLYADGSVDYGIAGYGPGGWSLGYYVRDGRPYPSNDNSYKMEYADEGYPLKAEFKLGSNEFKWSCNCRLNEVKGHVLHVNGQMMNTAVKEKPVDGFSWIEFRPHGAF